MKALVKTLSATADYSGGFSMKITSTSAEIQFSYHFKYRKSLNACSFSQLILKAFCRRCLEKCEVIFVRAGVPTDMRITFVILPDRRRHQPVRHGDLHLAISSVPTKLSVCEGDLELT